MMLTDGTHEAYPVNLVDHVADLGDVDLSTGNTEKALVQVETVIANLLAWNKHPISLGGDHSITLGILRAMNKVYNKVAVIHFDAHCDTWENNFDELYGHGTWLYNAIEEGLVDPTKVISIGVRSPADPETRSYLVNKGGVTFSAREYTRNPSMIFEQIFKRIGDTPCYLTFDIDAIDPAHAPGTGTPEIGGLTTMQVLDFLEDSYQLNWIGIDLVEVSPPYDHSQITALAAATFVWTYLSMVVYKSVVGFTECGDDYNSAEEVDADPSSA
jgi:agmatinase